MLTVDISLPDIEELHKLVTEGQEKGFLSYDEIVAGLEEVDLTKEQVDAIREDPADPDILRTLLALALLTAAASEIREAMG